MARLQVIFLFIYLLKLILYVYFFFFQSLLIHLLICRRYSDFYDLQQKIKATYSNLGKLNFPGKKTFHNMERATLEKRMKMLNDYLQILLQSGVTETHNKLLGMLLTFLEPGEYDKSSGPFAKTVREKKDYKLLNESPPSELISYLGEYSGENVFYFQGVFPA